MGSYPDDSIQFLAGTWWTTEPTRDLRRGRLLRAFVPHVDVLPYTLRPEGRADPKEHEKIVVRIEPLRVGERPTGPKLPVAALPSFPGEARLVQRAKIRPVIIVANPAPEVVTAHGQAKWQTAPTILVAPFYGADQDEKRAGWPQALVDRIRHCEYPQYVWDQLPVAGSPESILRLDHIQPIGRHSNSHEWTEHCLTPDALDVLDEWLTWIFTGTLPQDGVVTMARKELGEIG